MAFLRKLNQPANAGYTEDTTGDLYNPAQFMPSADMPSAGPAVPSDMSPAALPAAATPRWSPGLDRAPGWLDGADQQTNDWAQNVYNTQEDPGKYLQDMEGRFRDAASKAGSKLDASSANVLPLLDDFERGDYDFSGGGTGDNSQSEQSQPQSQSNQQDPFNLKSFLPGLFSGGQFNQDIVNRRTDNARDTLNRQRLSTGASNKAALASRGLIGDGPEITAQNRLDERLFNEFLNASSGIQANESENADERMMQALQLAAGQTSDNNRNTIDNFRAQTERQGTQGNLALGNLNATNDYNLGLGRFGLDRDRLNLDQQNMTTDQLIELLKLLGAGAETSAGGFY